MAARKKASKRKPPKHTRPGYLRAGESATILTPELHAALVRCVPDGDFRNLIAISCGIHPDTLKLWLRQGLSAGAEEPFLSFARDFLMAEARLRASVIRRLLRPGISQAEVSALTWYLDRRFAMWRGKDYEPGPDGVEAIDLLNSDGANQLNAGQAAALVPRLLAHPGGRAMLEAAGCTLPSTKETASVQAEATNPHDPH